MTSQKQKEILHRASAIGDSTADAALRDIHEEESGMQEESFQPPKKGDWVTVFTIGFHYAGRITGIDHEWIGLAPNHAWINTSGGMESVEQGEFTDWEMSKFPGYVAKGGVFYIKIHPKPIHLVKDRSDNQ
jgi:hypothetical protein